MKIKDVIKPTNEGYDLAGFSAPASTLGPDNQVSPIGTVPKGQQINNKKPVKKGKRDGRIN